MTSADVRIFLKAWLLLAIVDIGLRWVRFGRLMKWLEWRLPERTAPEAGSDYRWIDRTRRWVDAAANHHVVEMTCLRRALVLRRLLGMGGVASEVRLGVRRSGESVTAHAWLECGGRNLGESLDQFSVLESPE